MKAIDSPGGLTRAILAMQAFNSALALLPLVRMQKDTHAGAVIYGALCVYYARPFTNNGGFGMLSPKFIPADLKPIHDKLLMYRRKIAAHSDANHEYEGVSVNNVYFRSDGQGLYVEDRHLCPTNDFCNRIDMLLNNVRSVLSDAIGKCLNEGPPSYHSFPKGLYQLKGDDKLDWKFVPVPNDGLVEESA